MSQARRGLKIALKEFYPELANEEIREVIDLPEYAKRVVADIKKADRTAAQAQAKAVELKKRGTRRLQEKLGVSVRDIGDLMGISPARAQQLLNGDD